MSCHAFDPLFPYFRIDICLFSTCRRAIRTGARILPNLFSADKPNRQATIGATIQTDTARGMLERLVFQYKTTPFDFASQQLTPVARIFPTWKAHWIKACDGDLQPLVVGHFDDRGSNAYNNTLGALHANTVKLDTAIAGGSSQRQTKL